MSVFDTSDMYLASAVESVYEQSYGDLELLIVFMFQLGADMLSSVCSPEQKD